MRLPRRLEPTLMINMTLVSSIQVFKVTGNELTSEAYVLFYRKASEGEF